MTKRRAYDKNANVALKTSTLGQKRRMDGMAKLLARAGKGLTFQLPNSSKPLNEVGTDNSDASDEDDAPQWEEHKWEPLCLWQSPFEQDENAHESIQVRGLPGQKVVVREPDEYGIEREVTIIKPAPKEAYAKKSVIVPAVLAKWLRPHQREGVQFLYECTMSQRDYATSSPDGIPLAGCILADDMGLGKTLQSITLLYTLLKTSITADGAPSVRRVIIVCPCSLVKNWDSEIIKWIADGGPGPSPGVPPPRVMALAECDRATIEKNLDTFCRTNLFSVLIASYECLRTHIKRLTSYTESKCDLLICDEAHRLKNRENQTTRALHSLPCRRRVLLTGTPMQNDLEEFYAMVDFCNPGILGNPEDFRKKYLFPILKGREPDATDSQRAKMMERQAELSELVNQFIIRRVNTLNAQHLPPKLVQVVCINLTDVQRNMYEYLLQKMEKSNVLEGKQSNALGWIQLLMKLSNHPRLIADEDPSNEMGGGGSRRGCAANRAKVRYNQNDGVMAEMLSGVSAFLPYEDCGGGYGGRGGTGGPPVRPEWSGKMFVLWRLMIEMRRPHVRDKIVIVSNYTQTLDLIGKMCRENNWGFCRLDGSIGMKKRQAMVDDFNDPNSNLVAFLLSSKAGGCGLNLIGGNRLVLFDPDWNPAVDKQAAARCWRDGQKKRCFTYRFLATGTVEEKIFQRQLSKEGLQSVVDDKEQVNALATKDLRNLFKLRTNSPSDTHDKLNCKRCKIIHENSEAEIMAVLPLQLKECNVLLDRLCEKEDSAPFLKPLNPEEHEGGLTKEDYEKVVKQPIDLSVIRKKLSNAAMGKDGYPNVKEFARDVNRIFSNVVKAWPAGNDLVNASRRLQSWWVDEWSVLVPKIMSIKPPTADGDCDAHACDDDERGENFQEQIGMPDEENMRDWSHHFSTETCDDPVMRAAMKGFDSISFVFGLEVTWSLIQQRKEEEEEKAALEELNDIEDIDDGDDQDDEVKKIEEVEADCEDSVCETNEKGDEKKNSPSKEIIEVFSSSPIPSESKISP